MQISWINPHAFSSPSLTHKSVSLKFCCMLYQRFWIYTRIRDSFEHLRPVILSADWSIRRLQSWTCSSLPTVAEFVKLTQSIAIEIQRQPADLYKVQLCNRQFFVGVPAIYVVKVWVSPAWLYLCHTNTTQQKFCQSYCRKFWKKNAVFIYLFIFS